MEELKFSNNGHETYEEEESPEQLQEVAKRLSELTRPGNMITMGKQELSLLQKILSTASEQYREEQIWRLMSFMDEEEAYKHVAAYYEARDLGMDTSFNVAYAFALVSVNRKGAFNNNLLASLMDTLQHGKWANQYAKGRTYGTTNPRSPIGN